MRCLLTFLLAVALVCPAMGQVTAAEYFVDTDPGYGAATPISVTTGNNISKDFTLALASVAPGFHIIGVRAKDAQGHWSHTYAHSFYVISGTASTVIATEYYIDTDPGYGNAITIPVAIGSDSALNYVVPLTAYSTGFHTIGIRSKDNGGSWSSTLQHAFYITENNATVNITSLQYQFTGIGATDSIYTYNVPTPAPSVDLNFTANLSQLVGEREYNMHIWAVNAKGTRSLVLIKKLKVCSGEPAKARFDFIPLGTQVSFVDSSRGAGKYKWDFGDGTIDSVSNPVHNYTSGGTYNVKLIVSNFCNSDTVVRQVNVLSLQSMYPNKGGNNGSVTVTILGGGFTSQSVVKLVKGSKQITGVNISVSQDGKLLYTTYDLINEDLGSWDLIVQANSNIQTLTNAFNTEMTVLPQINLNIEGRDAIRRNVSQKYKLVFNNAGNVDARIVPFWLGLPNNTIVKFYDPILQKKNGVFDNDTIPLFIAVDTLLSQPTGETLNVYPFLLSRIPANSSTQYEIEIISTTILDTTEMKAWAFSPLKNSPIDQNFKDCIIESVKEQLQDEALDIACLNDVLESIEILDKNPCQTPQNWVDADYRYGNLPAREAKILGFCDKLNAESPLLMQSAYLPAFFSAFAIGCLQTKTISIGKKKIIESVTHDFKKQIALETGVFGLETTKKSFSVCKSMYSKILFSIKRKLRVVASSDPNEKIGNRGNSISNHIQGNTPLDYKIYFENKNTATAPAQEVIILDTLDKTKFDFTTFQLKSYGFGDSVNASIPSGLSFYATNTLLKRSGKPDLLVRIDAKLDTATGILKWRFLSLDPLTREFITDPLDGFLPPNVTSPQGEGFISYSVTPKADLPHGTVITNKATIYFDNNAPIVTNEFINTIDKVKPVSTVASIPIEVYDTTFTVQWSGTDNGAGVRSYDVYYKVNNGPYQLWQYDVSLLANEFPGQKDSTYSFFSISKDYAGNIETAKTTAERVVTVKMYDSSNTVCAGTITKFQATPAGVGFTFQWQVNQGTGFIDIPNNTIYSGTNTTELTLTTPPTIYTNYQYRCKISNGTVTYYSSKHALRFVSTWVGTAGAAWETPANWNCGVVPDENTHVIIPAGVPQKPIVNVNGVCKSLTVNSNSNIQIKTGVNLIITGKLND